MPLRQKAMEATRALRDAVYAASFDASKVAELATAAGKAEAAIVKAEIETWTQIRSILTAEQITKLQEMMSRRMGQGRNRRGGGGGAAPGAPPPRLDNSHAKRAMLGQCPKPCPNTPNASRATLSASDAAVHRPQVLRVVVAYGEVVLP